MKNTNARIIKQGQRLGLLILFFTCSLNLLFAQGIKANRSNSTNFIVIIYSTPPKIDSCRVLDSLIKLHSDTAVIMLTTIDGTSEQPNYGRLYKSGSSWNYDSNNTHLKSSNDAPDSLRNFSSLILGKHIFIFSSYTNSSKSERHCYFIMVNDEIIETLLTDVPIDKIPRFDTRVIKDLQYFERFDKYISKKQTSN